MRCVATLRVFMILTFVLALTDTASAFKKQERVPLLGCRGHFAASGSAIYTTLRGEPKTPDGEQLEIEIRNVPLRPGTTLFVYVAEQPVGSIKLDAKQGGTISLNSSFGKFVPPVGPGTSVVVKTVDGKPVLW